MSKGRKSAIGIGLAVLVAIAAMAIWRGLLHSPVQPVTPRKASQPKPKTPLESATADYSAGRYEAAEAAALSIVESACKTKDPAKLKDAAQAQYVAAFSAARRQDMLLARERFADLREQAANLADKDRDEQQPRTASPTLEEEAAYQHAVCTAALGERKAAEEEYLQFMRDYPESPLINGALKRVELLHDGHLPPEAEKVWMQATGTAQARQRERQKAADLEMSRCGPECLAEFLRRHNRDADAADLAEEMKTSEKGTSLLAMANALKKLGLAAKGLSLTPKGLRKQRLPLIALIMPGHYVIVERVTEEKIRVWDPFGEGVGKPSTRDYTSKDWTRVWSRVALVVEPKPSPAKPSAHSAKAQPESAARADTSR